MQPNQSVAGTPNQNAAGASPVGAGAAGAASGAGAASAAGTTGAASALAAAKITEPTPAAKAPEPNIMAQGASEKKNSKGMLYGLILCLILAIGGIGFGVWAMMDGNSQKEKLNSQISSLRELNNELQEQLSNAGTSEPTEAIYSNPVIPYGTLFNSSYLFQQDKTERVSIGIESGKIANCTVNEKIGEDGWQTVSQCSVGGIDGNIYKVVEFGEGHDNTDSMIGFIMEDGKIAYVRLDEFATNNSPSIAGYLNLEKKAIDALEVGVSESGGVGGYGSTVFVMSDGTFVKYDSAMLE